MKKKIKISKEDLERLYYVEKKSKYKIGKIYNCSFSTVLNRMRDYGMQPLSRSVIQSKYEKKDFCGDVAEKAYLIGFRLGDLNVYKTSPESGVIVVRCHTTMDEQSNLMKDIFSKYGQVTCTKNKKSKSQSINCFLNNSFSFLLEKKDHVPSWISKQDHSAWSFAAGYVDAEANIGIYDGRARFKIDSYDKNIIKWFFYLFKKNLISCPAPKIIGEKGKIYEKNHLYKYNEDVWRIRVSRKESLDKLLNILKPHLKHEKRIADLDLSLKNIHARRKI